MEIRCRLCAEAYHNHIEILEDARFISMVDYLFQLKVNTEDKLPSTVCEVCYEFVERTWQFKEQIDRAQLLLTEILQAVDALSADALETGVTELPACEHENKFETVDPNLLSNTIVDEEQDPKNLKQEPHNIIQSTGNEEGSPSTEKTVQKTNRVSKKIKRTGNNRKAKSEKSETFKDIEYVNADGTVVPKPGIAGWNSYQWTCFECNAILCEAEDLREHFASMHNTTSVRYICLDCPKVYTKYGSFISHVKYHRPFLKYSCDICYKWYATTQEVDSHKNAHYEGDPHQCTLCGKRFRVQSLLTLHTRSHLPSDLKNCYPCNHCPKKFGTKANLMAHKRIHLGIREYSCDKCGKSFVQKGNLDNHLLTHDNARPFQCNICDKSFKSLIRLRKHSSIHSGLKPHHCDICGRQFRERSTLKEHHRIHTGAMPFTCEFCGKCFRFKGVLTTHRRQHTGERPYSCTECQHHFTNWPNYNKHMKRRHGINTSVNCRTKQDIPPTGKPNRNPPGSVLAPPQPPPPVQVICQTSASSLETYNDAPTSAFYPVLGLYGITEDIAKGVL